MYLIHIFGARRLHCAAALPLGFSLPNRHHSLLPVISVNRVAKSTSSGADRVAKSTNSHRQACRQVHQFPRETLPQKPPHSRADPLASQPTVPHGVTPPTTLRSVRVPSRGLPRRHRRTEPTGSWRAGDKTRLWEVPPLAELRPRDPAHAHARRLVLRRSLAGNVRGLACSLRSARAGTHVAAA
jgi:hypothetical protein